jgi:hypothetical protein
MVHYERIDFFVLYYDITPTSVSQILVQKEYYVYFGMEISFFINKLVRCMRKMKRSLIHLKTCNFVYIHVPV